MIAARRAAVVASLAAGGCMAVPLVVDADYPYPFVVPKMHTFRLLVGTGAAVWIGLVRADPGRYRPRWSSISALVMALAALSAVSAVAGVDPVTSVWGKLDRQMGLATELYAVALFFLLASVASGWPWWHRLLGSLLACSAAVTVVMAAQRFVDPKLLHNHFGVRGGSTLGHPTYVGAFGAFGAFAGGLLAIRARGWRRIASLGGVAAALGSVAMAETRGAHLALAAGACASAGAYAASSASRRARRLLGLTLAGAAALGGVLLGTGRLASIPYLERWDGVLASPGAATRLIQWRIAIAATRDRPLLGWGPSNYHHAASAYYDPALLRFGWKETWYDDPHNVLLARLATGGVLGLIAYAGLLTAAVVSIWRGRNRGAVSALEASAITGLLATHLGCLLFSFEQPTSLVCFVVVLALVHERVTPRPAPHPDARVSSPAVVVGVLVAAFLASLEWTEARASRGVVSALKAVSSGDLGVGGRLADACRGTRRHRLGLDLVVADELPRSVERYGGKLASVRSASQESDRRDGEEVRRLRALGDGDGADAVMARRRREEPGRSAQARALAREGELLLGIVAAAHDRLGMASRAHPLDVRVALARARLAHAVAAAFTSSQLAASPDFVAESLVDLEAARRIAPRRQDLAYLQAALLLSGGRDAAVHRDALQAAHRIGAPAVVPAAALEERERRCARAIAVLQACLSEAPGDAETLWRLARAYQIAGRREDARRLALEAKAQEDVLTEEGRRDVAALLREPESP